jgi:cysteine desulfurase/selenocysteine lyase
VGEALSDEGIMARTGYFCVHYYLGQVLKVPPMIRFSLGYHVRKSDVDKVIKTMERMLG